MPARRLPIVPLAVGAVILALGLAHVLALRFTYDDAYISFRYAANLAHGHGLVYNVGERVEGYTNFLWTLIVAGVIAAGGDPERVSVWLTAAFALLALAAVLAFAHRRRIGLVGAGVLVAANGAWAAWGTGGLETALYGACVTWGVVLLARVFERPDARIAAASGLAFGLACLTRPDGLLATACAAIALAIGTRCGVTTLKAVRAWAVVVAACVVPHLAWRFAYYGQLVPNTLAVRAPGLGRFADGGRYLLGAATDLRLDLLALVVVIGLLVRGRRDRGLSRREGWLLAAIVIPDFAYVAWTGGDFMPLYRFVAPIVPLVALAAADRLDALGARLGRMAGLALAVAVLGAYAGWNLAGTLHQQQVWNRGEMVSVGWSRQEMDDWLRIGDLLGRVAQPTDTLATTAAGAIPYRSGLPTLDLHGLNAPDLSRYRRRDSSRPGHMLYLDERWLLERPPQILLGHPLVHPTPATLTVGLDLRPEWRDRVLANYQLVGLTLMGEPVRFVGCALRNDVADRILAAGRAAQR